jgi:uncharacterized protein YcbX
LQGEPVASVAVTPNGLEGDRRFGILDCATGNILTARREPQLLFASAAIDDAGVLTITLPDGSTAKDDDALSSWLGRRVELRAASDDFAGTYETNFLVGDDEGRDWFAWQGPANRFHDSERTVVSLVSAGTIGAWDPRRFRANVLLDGNGEDALVGSTVQLGDAVLDVAKQVDRCVMVTRPQPGGIERDVDVLKTINRDRAGNLAIGAVVTTPGRVAVGDELLPRD